ncbi:MAG: alcohol dehydrogenase catalytic domain-containing protein [candidate division WOR-3 bacterium]|nr:alcohol dehydrogenase catalytic domain-containing protein [candidate division WOR-3 bacterium]
MRVAVYYNNRDIRIEEKPIPQIGDDELLVKVVASGICGSDVMEWYRIKSAPRVLGHEISGEVVRTGKNVKNFKAGDRVFVSHHVPCNECKYCKKGYHTVCETLKKTNFDPGGFSEYLRVPEINVKFGTFLLPDEVSYEEGTFIEPLGCVIRGQRFAGIKKDDTVLVIGSGIAGILHIKLLSSNGIRKIIATDISEYRLDFARRCGAEVIHASDNVSERVKEINDGYLADVVIVNTTALVAFEQAFAAVDRAGTLLLFAPTAPDIRIPLPLFDLYFKGVKIVFSYAAVEPDIIEAIELLKTKKIYVTDMITHRLGLNDIKKGFELVEKADRSLKVIIEPQR